MKVAVILPAAGLGTRMGRPSAEKTGTSRKQFMLLAGSPILLHTVRKFALVREVAEIVVAVRAEDAAWVAETLAGEFPGPRVRVVEGGHSRQQSVENALSTLAPSTDLVVVHVPVDTVKQVTGGQAERAKIRSTLPREKLVLAQTPQAFHYELLMRAFQKAREDGFIGTDESSLVERLDVEVSVVLGSDRNIKITRPGDMDLARLFLQQENKEVSA